MANGRERNIILLFEGLQCFLLRTNGNVIAKDYLHQSNRENQKVTEYLIVKIHLKNKTYSQYEGYISFKPTKASSFWDKTPTINE